MGLSFVHCQADAPAPPQPPFSLNLDDDELIVTPSSKGHSTVMSPLSDTYYSPHTSPVLQLFPTPYATTVSRDSVPTIPMLPLGLATYRGQSDQSLDTLGDRNLARLHRWGL